MARRRSTPTDLALIAGFAALIAVCALLPAIPVGAVGVPITLQTFAVMLSGAVLGAGRGCAAVLLYLVAGLAGLPIFSGGVGGLAVLQGPTVGYLLAFPLAALVCGTLVQRLPRRALGTGTVLVFLCGLTASFLTIHPLGITGLVLRLDLSWKDALLADLPFWPGDVLKNIAMAITATAVHRAFPDLLGRPGRSSASGASKATGREDSLTT